MNDWQSMETAPKDGTIIEFTNSALEPDCVKFTCKWGKFELLGKIYDSWILVKDYSDFMPGKPGSLVRPSKWRPDQAIAKTKQVQG